MNVIKEHLENMKMEQDSLIDKMLAAREACNKAIQSLGIAQAYVSPMMTLCSCCSFLGWIDKEDSNSLGSKYYSGNESFDREE